MLVKRTTCGRCSEAEDGTHRENWVQECIPTWLGLSGDDGSLLSGEESGTPPLAVGSWTSWGELLTRERDGSWELGWSKTTIFLQALLAWLRELQTMTQGVSTCPKSTLVLTLGGRKGWVDVGYLQKTTEALCAPPGVWDPSGVLSSPGMLAASWCWLGPMAS